MGAPPDFEARYAADADPWQVGSLFYERRKIDIVLASLTRARYASAWDAACGTGHLTELLAVRADHLVASDLSSTAARLTAARCCDLDHVDVTQSALPTVAVGVQEPDLVVLSEVFYYLDDRERAATLAMVDDVAAPTSEVVAVHWNQVPGDAWLGGRAAQHEIVARLATRGWTPSVHHTDAEFDLDIVRRGIR